MEIRFRIVAVLLTVVFCMDAAAAKEKKRDMKPPKDTYVLYLPGKGNKSDAVKDAEKQGWLTGERAATHFSLLESDTNKKRVLLFDTVTDDNNDMLILPLSGDEKRVTVLFKVFSSFDEDTLDRAADGSLTGKPFGAFYAFVQKGEWQSLLRHTGANLIRGSRGTSRLTADGSVEGRPVSVAGEWHDVRLVFDTEQADAMTSLCFIDGRLVHTDRAKRIDFLPEAKPLDWNTLMGTGQYLAFGDGDGATKTFARYAYILVVRNEDVSGLSLEELEKKVKADLVTAPTLPTDPTPPSKRPERKPSALTMTAEDFALPAGGTFTDRAAIEAGMIDLERLPTSRARVQKVVREPPSAQREFAAVVDRTGTDGAFRTIGEAIHAVPPGAAILVRPGLYYEPLIIEKPISLVGTNPATTVIFGYEADTHTADGNTLVSVRLAEQEAVFSAENITFYNKGAEWNKAWGSTERRAVALAVHGAGEAVLTNCLFLGQRNTLLLESRRAVFARCYVEGDEDIITVNGAVQFSESHIHVLANGGTVLAPLDADDRVETTALVFRDCVLTADKMYAHLKDGKKLTLVRGAQEKTADISHDSAQEAPARISVLLSNTEIPRAFINSASPALK